MEVISQISAVVTFIITHAPEIIAAMTGVLSSLIALFLLVPGSQPEATLQKGVDFLAKFSKKPVEKKE